jgi:hypothetical protein
MISSPKVSAGLSTYFGLLLTLLGAGGAVVAAVQANDTATITAGVGSIVAALSTIGGRMAQAVALARRVAPFVQAGAVGVASSNVKFAPSLADPALDDPAHPGDEPELTADDLADRVAEPVGSHGELGG